jgi:hypothetical protein
MAAMISRTSALAAACLIAAVLATPAVAEEPPPPPAAQPSFEERVNAAIDRGVEWLRKRGGDDPDWGVVGGDVTYDGGSYAYRYPEGCTALALLTLLKCGVAPDDPQIVKGFERIARNDRVPTYNYDLAVILLALEAQSNPWKRNSARERAERDASTPEGKKKSPPKRVVKDAAWIAELAAKLQTTSRKGPGWRYGHPGVDDLKAMRGDKDLSNTVFVVMALHTARSVGVKVPDAVFADTAAWVLDLQEKDGPKHPRWTPQSTTDAGYAPVMDRARGWAYMPRSTLDTEAATTGSMTGAGITTLLLCRRALTGSKSKLWTTALAARTETAIADGTAWLDLHWNVDANPGSIHYTVLHLYGLERVGDLQGLHLIGGHNWYREGAESLLKTQREDGSWFGNTHIPQDLITTCFALLFLDRASLAITGDD